MVPSNWRSPGPIQVAQTLQTGPIQLAGDTHQVHNIGLCPVQTVESSALSPGETLGNEEPWLGELTELVHTGLSRLSSLVWAMRERKSTKTHKIVRCSDRLID